MGGESILGNSELSTSWLVEFHVSEKTVPEEFSLFRKIFISNNTQLAQKYLIIQNLLPQTELVDISILFAIPPPRCRYINLYNIL